MYVKEYMPTSGYIIVVKCDKLIGEILVMIPVVSVWLLSYNVLSA